VLKKCKAQTPLLIRYAMGNSVHPS